MDSYTQNITDHFCHFYPFVDFMEPTNQYHFSHSLSERGVGVW